MLRALAALVLLAAAPASTTGAGGGGRLAIVTTTTDLKALVEAVGGDRVSVESLASPAQDPHTVEVKPGQLARLKTADLLVRIGLDHEPWLWPALRALADVRFQTGTPHYLDASRGVTLLQAETARVRSERGVHVHAFGNTHYWLDPENAKLITAAIAASLAALSPADRPVFHRQRTAFIARLDEALTRWSRALAPHRGARVVVMHDSWPYFASRFGLNVVSTIEPTPGVPPSPSWIADLTRRMRETGVKVVIAEPFSNAAVVRQVAARGGATVVTLVPSVGAAAGVNDYLDLFEANVTRLATALGGAR